MAVTVTGAEGVLRWGYRRAALLRAWTVSKGDDGAWTVTGTLDQVDRFAVSQRPLKFLTPNGWCWPLDTLQITDGTLTASLGPKESLNEQVRSS